MLGSLVDALRRNVSRGRRDVALFEVGLVTRPGADGSRPAPVPGVDARPDDATVAAIEAAVPRQPRHVGILAAGDADRGGWWGPGRPVDWSDVVDAARAVAHALAVELVVDADREHAPWHPGRCARLSLPDGTLVGHAGELHPQVCAALDLPARTCAAELDVDVLTAASEPTTQFVPFSDYPVALTDVALVVDAAVPAAQVERALRAGAGDALESVELFDVYAGEQVGEGRTSLAYRMAFRAPDRTLTTEEVNAVPRRRRRLGRHPHRRRPALRAHPRHPSLHNSALRVSSCTCGASRWRVRAGTPGVRCCGCCCSTRSSPSAR